MLRTWLVVVLAGCTRILDLPEPRPLGLTNLEVRDSDGLVRELSAPFDPATTTYEVTGLPAERLTITAIADDPEIEISHDSQVGTGMLAVDASPNAVSDETVDFIISAVGETVLYQVVVRVVGVTFVQATAVPMMPSGIEGLSLFSTPSVTSLVAVTSSATNNVYRFLPADDMGVFSETAAARMTATGGVAIATGAFVADIAVARNTAVSTFLASENYLIEHVSGSGTMLDAVAVSNFIGQGNSDLALLDRADDRLVFLEGAGDGTFTPHTSLPTADQPLGLILRGQGVAYVTKGTEQLWFITNNAGVFTESHIDLGVEPRSLAAADFDEDGMQDYAIVVPGDVRVVTKALDATPVFTDLHHGEVGSAIAVQDLDQDRRVDIVVATTGGILVYFNRTTGFARVRIPGPILTEPPTSLVLADLTRDGLVDIAYGTNAGLVVFRGVR